MKRIILLLTLLLLVALLAHSQTLPFTPGAVPRSNASLTTEDYSHSSRVGAYLPRFLDTTQANLYIKMDTCGNQIYTYLGNKVWVRGCSPKRWIEQGAGSGSSINPNLQQVTDIGFRTTDTTIFGGIRTNYITADTSTNPDYEIVIFPDLQNMTNSTGYFYSRSMFNWVRDSAAYYNVKAVLQVGDLVNDNTTEQWDTLDAQVDLLDPSGIPYIMPPGNHDYGNGFNPATRDATLYNTYMGVSRFAAKPFYGGHYGTTNENYWIKFSAGTKKYMAVGLEFLPRDVVLTWAGNIIDSVYATEPDREVMIVTHAYITSFGERSLDSSVYSTAYYGMSADNDGQEIWDKLIRKKRSIKWVFSGHYLIPGAGYSPLTSKLVSVNDYGDLVNQIYINYQDMTNGGDGYFMRLHFRPSKGEVYANVYSSYFKIYETRLNTSGDSVSYTLNIPSINMAASVGIQGDLSVGKDFRVQGKLKNDRLTKYRFPYIGEDHGLKDTADVFFNSTQAPSGSVSGSGLNFNWAKLNGHLWVGNEGRLTSQPTVNANNPGYVFLILRDSMQIMDLGRYNESGNLQLIGKGINSGNPGGVDVNVNYDYPINGNGLRVNFTNRNSLAFERKYRLGRRLFFAWGEDSLSFNFPAYKFAGLPRSTSATHLWVYDSTSNYASYVRIAELGLGSGSGTPTLQQVLTAGSTLIGSNTITIPNSETLTINGNNAGSGLVINVNSKERILAANAHTIITGGTGSTSPNQSAISVGDSIHILPYQGKLNIDSLRSGYIDTTNYKPLARKVSLGGVIGGDIVQMNSWAQVLGGGATTIVPGTTPVTSGTDDLIFYQAANKIAQDAGLKFNGTSNTFTVTGPTSSLTNGPKHYFNFDSDANSPLNYFIYNHANISMGWDAWFDGAGSIAWKYSDPDAFVLQKAGGNFIIHGNAGGTPGNTFTPTARLTISSAGVTTISNLAGTGTRNVVVDASGVMSAPVSDRSVKQNIRSLDYGLSTIMKLKPVSYEFREGWKNYGQGKQVGFIAQDVQKVMPNSVFTTESTGKMGYNATDIIPVLVKAIQELTLKVQQLEKENRKVH